MTPTAEQVRALELFATGESLAIEAGAGTGKTSTLVLLAEQAGPRRRGQYVAFNKALVEDSKGKFPLSVASNTAHSLAFRAVMTRERQQRLQSSRRVPGWELARILDVQPIEVMDFEGKTRTLAAGFLASHVMRAITQFCQTADENIGPRHFPYLDGLDRPMSDGRRTYTQNANVSMQLLPIALRAWEDIGRPYGQVPFKHEHYLKLWQLSDPRIDADYVLFDEAQDANPVIASIVANQTHAQLVYVGDSQQEIYAWTGAVNALAEVEVAHRTQLSQSFRFGQAIAEQANAVLDRIPGATLRLTGNPAIQSTIETLALPKAILTRTNALGITRLLELQRAGRAPHFLGGSNDILGFARAAEELQVTGHTGYPELACFDGWEAVRAYVAGDEDGSDLRLNVKLVEQFGTEAIIRGLEQMVPESRAEIVISTAHKSKGRQWPSVQLASDFRMEGSEEKPVGPPELRLLYVAVTRAQQQLDIDAITPAKAAPEPVADKPVPSPVWGPDGELKGA